MMKKTSQDKNVLSGCVYTDMTVKYYNSELKQGLDVLFSCLILHLSESSQI